MALTAVDTNQELNKHMAELFDDQSWVDNFGYHIHHGFYDIDANANRDQKTAQIRMINEALLFANVSEDSVKKPKSIVDVGCGVGGPAVYLGRKYGAKCKGIDISPRSIQKATEISNAQGLGQEVTFQVGDALQLAFPDGQFDLVWSMECGECVSDKAKFVSELVRVVSPGGTIIFLSSCHRDLAPNEESLKPEEKELFEKISESLFLPAWISCADFVDLFKSHSMKDIKSANWSEHIAPFWDGWKPENGTMDMEKFIEGHRNGLIKFSIITCKKPE
ncbi:hypothetical protein GIB67_030344 [Kingdonia uniflora]|uniref:Methyltransferase type 11 domain-containing protein n=1 Tax=Kingdonia uniflora TaxID=39325 RepID=A0A7J7M6P1_9MAGN|nr:hypothetical protein GIB67_030344 [Kingdonia uniflora]